MGGEIRTDGGTAGVWICGLCGSANATELDECPLCQNRPAAVEEIDLKAGLADLRAMLKLIWARELLFGRIHTDELAALIGDDLALEIHAAAGQWADMRQTAGDDAGPAERPKVGT